jgi:hypothetical protein
LINDFDDPDRIVISGNLPKAAGRRSECLTGEGSTSDGFFQSLREVHAGQVNPDCGGVVHQNKKFSMECQQITA